MVHRLLLACRSPPAANSKITMRGALPSRLQDWAPMPGRSGRA
ncbi:hypothetical protein BF49_6220 [Bradyrhizobium sp.]|nr:hypothetical protein BF49_6220 [Bradyrhizobium sp.]